MSAGFTPGPWGDLVPSEAMLNIRVNCGSGEAIANVWGLNAEAQANARLIAAAPELYELLRWIEVFADVRSKDDSKVFARVNRGALWTIRDKANAALAKARGEA